MSFISPKAVAVIIAAIAVISSSFFVFHLSYSTQIPDIKCKIKVPDIFEHEEKSSPAIERHKDTGRCANRLR